MSNYSKASRGAQWFADRYPGAKITPNCGVLHTTEGASWPSYGGGSYAPTYTANPDIRNRRVLWRAHFPDEMSARALVNAPGGVETNTANAIQVELVGTCDDKHAVEWPGVGKAGVDYIYWPDAPDWALAAVADFLRDMHARHGIPLDGPDMWLRYGKDDRRPGVWPASYGASPARLSFSQWREFEGWCGHQHVPENSHGDPGALPFARIVAMAKGALEPTSVGLTIADLQALLGVTPDGAIGPATEAAVREYQSTHGLTVDGDPGPITLGEIMTQIDRIESKIDALPARFARHPVTLGDHSSARLGDLKAITVGGLLQYAAIGGYGADLDTEAIASDVTASIRADVLSAVQSLDVKAGATPQEIAEAVADVVAARLTGTP